MSVLKKIAVVCAVASLSGCAGYSAIKHHTDTSERIEDSMKDVIGKRDFKDPTPYVKKLNRVYVEHLSKEDIKMPDWFHEPKGISGARKIAFLELLQKVFAGIPVNFQFLEGVKENEKVTIPELSLTYAGILEYLSSLTGYSYTVRGNDIVFKKYEVATFPIRHLPGNEQYALGKKGIKGDSSSSRNSSQEKKTGNFIGGSEQEFSVLSGKLDVMHDVKLGIDEILGCRLAQANTSSESAEGTQESASSATSQPMCEEGASSKILRSTSSIFVRAVPSQMRMVEDFIKEKNSIFSRQVSVQISLINVEFTDENQLTVDLDLVAESVSKGLKAATTSDINAGILGGLNQRTSFTLGKTDGPLSNTELYLAALSEQGAVSKKTLPRVIATNNRVGTVGNIDRVNYISGREVFTTASVGSEYSIIQSEAETGFLLYCLPNIGEHDAILKLSTSQSSLLDIEPKGEGNTLVESPVINDKVFNTTIRVDFNKPVLIAGLSKTSLQTNGADGGLIPSSLSRSSTDVRSETILMIEVVPM